jgi:hypothetical protein
VLLRQIAELVTPCFRQHRHVHLGWRSLLHGVAVGIIVWAADVVVGIRWWEKCPTQPWLGQHSCVCTWRTAAC